jgi:formylmethanofuran dehydrogenase subunit E
MDKTEILRSIHHDQLEYIQRKVQVNFDNRRQEPVSFSFAGQTHTICEVVGLFKMFADQPPNSYLVEASNHNVFYIYYQLEGGQHPDSIEPGFWVLCFRILNDNELMSWYLEDRKMLVNMTLKRVADFHGHICPELALGGKFCEFVQSLLEEGTLTNSGLSIISENTTSALDAIQVLLGVTIGNQRLMVMDYGKHNYTLFSRQRDRGWKLKLKAHYYDDEDSYHSLEEKIFNKQALFEDMVRFQQLMDARVRQILELSPKELFSIEEVNAETRPKESVSIYLTCSVCGEQVLASRSIESRDTIFCVPCFQKMTPGCSHYGMQ